MLPQLKAYSNDYAEIVKYLVTMPTRVNKSKRTEEGLIFSPQDAGWWDSDHLSSPQVIRLGDSLWRMWYYGRDSEFDPLVNLPSGRVGLAESVDGVRWIRIKGPLTKGAVFEPVPASETRFDNAHLGVADVHYEDGLYWQWYFGGDQTIAVHNTPMGEYKSKGMSLRIGCAVSRDGTNWIRLEGPYMGAMVDVGGPGCWDAIMCGWPRVIRSNEGKYLMYYHSLDPDKGTFWVGLATSEDGLTWQKMGKVFGPGEPGTWDERGVRCRHIIRAEDRLQMFYEGVDKTGTSDIGIAVSTDGITWERDITLDSPGGPVFRRGPPGAWDAQAIGAPFVLPMPDGSYRMYYVGACDSHEQVIKSELATKHQIGLAVSDGSNFRSWRRYNAC